MGREGHCKKIPLTCVGSVHGGWTTLGLLQPKVECISGSTLLRLQDPLHGYCFTWALSFMQFPGLNHSGSWVLSAESQIQMCYTFCASQVWAAQVTRCLESTLSKVGHVSYSPPQSWPLDFPGALWEHNPRCAMCLLWGADLMLWHSWQMSTTQDFRKTWLATGKLLTVWWKMQSLGLRLQQPFAFLLWVLSACLSASREEGPYMAASLPSFGISWILVLWACQGLLWGLRVVHRKFFFF